MELHLKLSGIFTIAVGIIGVIACISILFLSGGPSGVLLINAREGGSASTTEGVATACYMGYLFLMAFPLVAVGRGLLRFQSWARDAGVILSIISLLHFPFGTIVGIYNLWVLNSFEIEPLFKVPLSGPARGSRR